jgi:hypothetical protein
MSRLPAHLCCLLVSGLVPALLALPASAAAAPPTPTGLPQLTGQYRAGQVVTTTKGTWSPSTGLTQVVTWERCDEDGEGCTPIAGVSDTKYTLQNADIGATVRSRVQATNVDGTNVAYSAVSPVVGDRRPPVIDTPPSISGTLAEGSTLTVSNGTWTGPGTPTFTRRWQRCTTADPDSCADITPAATGTTYKLVPADIAFRIRAVVTATTSDGSTEAVTAMTGVVQGVPPSNTVAPTLSGTAREGQTLKIASNGTWKGTAELTYAYAWHRCDAAGDGCAAIDGAESQTYTLTADDVGGTVRGVVRASNPYGTASAGTVPSATVAPKAPPAPTAPPEVRGQLVDAQTLTAFDGTWTGTTPITPTRVWQRCDFTGTLCEDMPATGTTYKLVSSDVGSTFRIRVTARNADGETTGTSAATAPVQPALPAATTPPVVSGTTKEGNVLSATAGKWTGTPDLSYAYQWRRCTGTSCTDLDGETGTTYRLTPADVGKTIRVAVRATNAAGTSAPAESAPSATILTGPPVNVDLPSVSGALPRHGETWTSDVGTWAGTGAGTSDQVHERQWQRCSATGTGCVAISGAVGETYTLTAADVNKTVRVRVRTLSPYGFTDAFSPVSPVIAPAPPALEGAVTIDGDLVDGKTLTARSTWSGTPPVALTWQWRRCDLAGMTCEDIPGATKETYTLTAQDVGSRIAVYLGATNEGGGANATGGPTLGTVAGAPPEVDAVPVVTGTTREGATLTTTLGSFSGTPPLTYEVQWERCSSAGSGCVPIPGATEQTYTLTAADRGHTLRSVVTATSGAGGAPASAASAPTAIVALAPPANTIAPAVTPDTGLRSGVLLTADPGAWTGSEPIELGYRWQRCNAAGASCTDIPGEAGQTYRATDDVVGSTIRVVVTATNGAGNVSTPSPVTGIVGTNPPVSTTPPELGVEGGGPAKDGATLRTTKGGWSGAPETDIAYEWWRCDAAGENCSRIANETQTTYRLRPADVGRTVRARVILTNPGGTTAALSGPSDVVAATEPENVVRPQVLGAATVGKTLTAEPGIWNGTPELRFAYQWQRCELDGTGCADLPGQEASTHRLTEADDGMTVRVVVTATNDVGSASATSPTTAEVQDEPPTKLVDPAITSDGLIAQGAVLEADPGAWAGAQPIDFAYRWRRCDATLAGCTDIAGASGTSYQLTKDDVGKRVLVVVTATNVVDFATAQSEATPVVLPEPPANTTPPGVSASGGLHDGAKLIATNGAWRGALPLTHTVIWLRCDEDGDDCVPVTDAHSTTYTLTSDDVGSRMRARVTATNTAASVSADSAPTGLVTAAPPAVQTRPSLVVLDGKAAVGGRLRGVPGSWTGTAPMSMSYRWQRCAGTSTAACDDVPGATGIDYVLTPADVGLRLRLVVTATNAGGTVTAESTPSTVVPAVAPDTADVPAIHGGPVREGVTLTGTAGRWSGTAPITLAYQWERCKDPGASSCPKITGAVRETFTPTSADVGAFLRLTVTAVNSGGKAVRSSVPVGPVEGIPPVNVGAPTIRASAVKVGGTLTATTGQWRGTAPLKYEVRWQRCDTRGICSDVDGGTKTTYKLTAADVDGSLLAAPMRAVVVATNVAGVGEAASPILGTTVTTGGAGAVGDAAAGVAKKGGKAKGAAGTVDVPKALRGVKRLARVKKVSISSKGRLTLRLTCEKRSRASCGAVGRLTYRSMSLQIIAGPIEPGKTGTVSWSLTKAQRKLLKGRRSVALRLRIAAPATQSIAKIMKRKATVPKKLRGKVRSSKKKKASRRKKAGAGRRR